MSISRIEIPEIPKELVDLIRRCAELGGKPVLQPYPRSKVGKPIVKVLCKWLPATKKAEWEAYHEGKQYVVVEDYETAKKIAMLWNEFRKQYEPMIKEGRMTMTDVVEKFVREAGLHRAETYVRPRIRLRRI